MGNNVYLLSDYSLYKFSFTELRIELFYELYEKNNLKTFHCISSDPKNKRLYLGIGNSILILEEDLSNNFSIEKVHDLNVNHLDVNSNKNHQLLSTANENFMKFWDIRQTHQPNLIVTEKSTLITGGSFNYFYD